MSKQNQKNIWELVDVQDDCDDDIRDYDDHDNGTNNAICNESSTDQKKIASNTKTAAATTKYVSNTTAATTTVRTSAGTNVAFTLSGGRIIDDKNTLQSFDDDTPVLARIVTKPPIAPAHPTTSDRPILGRLPDGRIIDGRNTLQSFDVVPTPTRVNRTGKPTLRLPDHRTRNMYTENPERSIATDAAVTEPQKPPPFIPFANTPSPRGEMDTNRRHIVPNSVEHRRDIATVSDPDHDIGDGDTTQTNIINVADVAVTNTSAPSNRGNRTNNNGEGMVVQVEVDAEAVPVRSLAAADAELFDSRIDLQHPCWKRNVMFWLAIVLAMILGGVVAGIGVYCGSGNCGATSSTKRH